MENYELNIEAPPKRYHNYFPKGHKPFNKGIQMKEWMDGRKIRKVKKYLEIGRRQGNHDLPGANRKAIVGIKDGKIYPFDSAVNAAKILKAKGIRVNAQNINAVCNKRVEIHGARPYIRKKAGGFNWFFADDLKTYSDLLNND
jgi:hypothetical protein